MDREADSHAVFLVDPNGLERIGLCSLLDEEAGIEIAGHAATAEELIGDKAAAVYQLA